MSERNTLVRALHDLGLAAWFGGSLMGATGLNPAASAARDPAERLRLSSQGWASWTPWQIAAVGAHTVGGIGLLVSNRKRLGRQPGAGSATVVKLLVTLAAAGTTAYAGLLGSLVRKHQDEGAAGATEPGEGASSDALVKSQQQLKYLQWATPVLTGVAVVLGAVEGEQQRGPGGLLDYSAADLREAAKRTLRRVA